MKKLFCLFISAACIASASAEEKKKKEDAPTNDLGALSSILPKGKEHKGITFPMFDATTGKLSTVLLPHVIVRRDEEYLDIKDMLIEIHSATGQIDYRIKLLTALYHMPTKLLSSNDRTLIEGDSFTLEGDTMIYDPNENVCRMTGDIRMVIANPSAMLKKPEPEPQTPAPASPPQSQTPAPGQKPESK